MISVIRSNIPNSLLLNQLPWTADLNNLVKQYAGYRNIPDNVKKKVLNNYNQEDVKKALSDMSSGKCIYCEAYIEHIDFPHIEHYFPKSLFHKLAFKWSNLFLSCAKCNIHKGDEDTKQNPIINPEVENPEAFFVFKDLRIQPSPTAPEPIKSHNTIRFCDLQRVSLSREHAEVTFSFQTVETKLEETIPVYSALVQNAARLRKANEILEALDNLKEQCSSKSSYAGYLRYLVRESHTITQAVTIVDNHSAELGLVTHYLLP